MNPNISNWRFCKVRKGEKVPYPANWQNMPLTLDKIPKGENYGLLSGEHSGILAIDFDGPWAFEWWTKNLPDAVLPETICWSSGKEGRIQYAYLVKEEYWKLIRTVKYDNGLPKPDKEGIEFRWNGCQSVLPPSIHPDTHKPYQWIGAEEVTEIPDGILAYLIEVNLPQKPIATTKSHTKSIGVNSPEIVELDKALCEFNKHYPSLSYDMWRNITWACITHVGQNAGLAAMMTFYPEQVAGEYEKLARTYHTNNAPSIGTIIHLIHQHNPTFNTQPKYKNFELVKEILYKHRAQTK